MSIENIKIIKIVSALLACLLSAVLAGCGSYGRGAYDAGPATYYSRAFVRWPASHLAVTWRVVGGEAHLPFAESPAALARKGADAWSNALAGRLEIREAATNEAEDISIRIVSNAELARIDDPHAATHSPLSNLFDRLFPELQGETFLDYVPGDPAQHLAHADIYIADGVLGNRVREVTAHEMGHALGIRGHSPYRGDEMFAEVPHTATPSPRDTATVQALYPLR